MAIGPDSNFPSLLDVANLVRSVVDDDKRGITGTAGEGQILTNLTSGVSATQLPQYITLTNFMNLAIREVRRDVNIMGQPTFIRDNYLLLGLPPINSCRIRPARCRPACQHRYRPSQRGYGGA
jgi:hypothetical protein